MDKWTAERAETTVGWNVARYDENGDFREFIVVNVSEATARRIAKLPELEAEVELLRTRIIAADSCIDHLYCGGADDESCEETAAYYRKYPGDEACEP